MTIMNTPAPMFTPKSEWGELTDENWIFYPYVSQDWQSESERKNIHKETVRKIHSAHTQWCKKGVRMGIPRGDRSIDTSPRASDVPYKHSDGNYGIVVKRVTSPFRRR